MSCRRTGKRTQTSSETEDCVRGGRGGGDDTKEASVTRPVVGNPPKEVLVSPLAPLGHCSLVYNEILPGGLQS